VASQEVVRLWPFISRIGFGASDTGIAIKRELNAVDWYTQLGSLSAEDG